MIKLAYYPNHNLTIPQYYFLRFLLYENNAFTP